jgi:hypothetical protein
VCEQCEGKDYLAAEVEPQVQLQVQLPAALFSQQPHQVLVFLLLLLHFLQQQQHLVFLVRWFLVHLEERTRKSINQAIILNT